MQSVQFSMLQLLRVNRKIYLYSWLLCLSIVATFFTLQVIFVFKHFEPHFVVLPILLGTVVGLILGTAIALRKDLLVQRQLFRAIADLSYDFSYYMALDGGMNYISPAVKKLTGYAAEAFYSNPGLLRQSIHPEDRKRWDAYELDVANDGVSQPIELRIIDCNGSERWVLHVSVCVKGEDGLAQGLSSTNTDITDRKLIEREIVVLNAYLEARVEERTHELTVARNNAEMANRAKTEFISFMSHELRTPLNAIMGFSEILAIDETLSPQQKHNNARVREAGKHLLNLINELLDMAGIESGKTKISLEPVDLCQLLEESHTLITNFAQKSDIRLEYDKQSCPKMVIADYRRLKQVMLNLLSNAIKYNSAGGAVQIKATVVNENFVRINVIDTGKGFDMSRVNELFEPFNRLDREDGDIEGTGIGLGISKRLVEMMQGTFGVESEIDKGSCFWIELPLSVIDDKKYQSL